MNLSRRKNIIIRAVVILGLVSFTLGCGEGFNLDPNLTAKATNNNGQGTGGGVIPVDPVPVDELPDIDGKVDGGLWDGKEIFEIDWVNMELIIKLPMDFQSTIVGGSLPIPTQEDISIEIVTNIDGNQQLQVRVPIAKFLGDGDMFNNAGLPNGDPLPMVPGGILPRIDTSISNQDVHFYLGKGTLAVFVPTNFNPYVTLVFPIKNGQDQTLGFFATIAKKGNYRGGFYASVQLPDDILKNIGDYLPISTQ